MINQPGWNSTAVKPPFGGVFPLPLMAERSLREKAFNNDQGPDNAWGIALRFKDATVCKAYLVGCCPLDAPLGVVFFGEPLWDDSSGRWKNRCGELNRMMGTNWVKVLLGRGFSASFFKRFSLAAAAMGLPGRCWAASANLPSVRSAMGLRMGPPVDLFLTSF